MNPIDKKLYDIIEAGIDAVENFRVDFEDDKKLQRFLEILDAFFSLIDNPENKFEYNQSLAIQKRFESKKEVVTERDLTWRRKGSAMFFLNNSMWKDKMETDEEIWSDMDRFLTEGTMNEYSKKIPLYYKNFMPNDKHSRFEEMVDLIRDELISYHTKLVYCKKILDFLNDEFSEQGVFPAQTNFLYQYLNTASSEMILVSTKLFSTANTKKSVNFGFDYLKSYISQNSNNNNEVKAILGGELRNMINEGKKKCPKLIELRNSLIAHYDIEKVSETKKIKISYEELNEIYELSVIILQKLSFYRFDRLSCIYPELIRIHGFKHIVCQRFGINNKHLDIDDYFSMLRKSFLPELIKMTEELNSKKD